jgi:membrane fusion protein (multidrug efflux system)
MASEEKQIEAPRPLESPAEAARRPWRRFVVLLLVLGAGGWFGWRWWQHEQHYVTTDDATLDTDLLPVTSEVAGSVLHLNVDDNEAVTAGQVLVELDPRPFAIAVQRAEAALHVAEQQAQAAKAGIAVADSQAKTQAAQATGGVSQASAGIETAQAQVEQAQTAVQSAQAKVGELQANVDLAQTKYDRYADLAEKGYVTTQELDNARNELATAQAKMDAAREDVKTAQARVTQAQANVQQARAQKVTSGGQVQAVQTAKLQTQLTSAQYDTAQAQVELARATLAAAQLDLERTKIKAVAAGRVGRKAVAPGMQVAPGQNLLAVVTPRLWVEANFKETQMRRIRPGQGVEVDIDALPGVHFHGTVDSFSPASGATFSLLPPENATGNFTKVVQRIPVKILLDEADVAAHAEQLAPGMSVVVHVQVQ